MLLTNWSVWRPSKKEFFNDGNIVGEKKVLGSSENAKTFTSRFWQGVKYPLTSFFWCYFNIRAPPPDPAFTPSTSKVCLATWAHPFEDYLILWHHLHLFHVIKWTHQFFSFVHPCKLSLTFISRSLLNLVLSVVVDCNTINMICNMIWSLQQGMCSTRNGNLKLCLKFPFF